VNAQQPPDDTFWVPNEWISGSWGGCGCAYAARNHFEQEPQFESIKSARHEVGDFFFLPEITGLTELVDILQSKSLTST
jgi:hypothetical protein